MDPVGNKAMGALHSSLMALEADVVFTEEKFHMSEINRALLNTPSTFTLRPSRV